MNTEGHYMSGGEAHYERVKRLGLSWCRANITKYAERTKGTPTEDLIKVCDYALMELEGDAIVTESNHRKLKMVALRMADLVQKFGKNVDVAQARVGAAADPSYPAAKGYVDQDRPVSVSSRDWAQDQVNPR